jgi:hypothetical protein
MGIGAKSFVKTFERIYESVRQKQQDHQWLEVYYAKGTDRIIVTKISDSTDDDDILIIDGFDLSRNQCVVVARIETIDFIMKFEEKVEDREYRQIGFQFKH